MAVGEFAEPIYKLLDDLGIGAEEAVLGELIQWLSCDAIRDFVEDYRRVHSMVEEEADSLDNIGFEDYQLCMDCQESYDIDKPHVCPDDATELIDWSANSDREVIFFTSRIPEC